VDTRSVHGELESRLLATCSIVPFPAVLVWKSRKLTVSATS
jgi:hypothetical protein